MFSAAPKLGGGNGGVSSTASTLFSTYASLSTSLVLVRTMAHQLVPHQYRPYLYSIFRRYIWGPLTSNLTLVIKEYSSLTRNQIFEAAELYLPTKISAHNDRLQVSKTPRQKIIHIGMEAGQEVVDTFEDINLKWRYSTTSTSTSTSTETLQLYNRSSSSQTRQVELTFHKKHRAKVTESYLPYVLAQAAVMKQKDKVVKLYTRSNTTAYNTYGDDGNGAWSCVNLEHPATFDTMAMEPDLKRMVMEDLDQFVKRKEFYKKVGKAWKRGYLLYGPPGTGKSSLIAAMAYHIKFDVYDLELTSLLGNAALRRVLLSTTNRSILVIEDIDCTVETENRAKKSTVPNPKSNPVTYRNPMEKITLSGLLNFIDGLWSSCGDERIIVFTTNHRDKLDHALLRPGRMDVHINMSYCTPSGFKTLAYNYLDIQESKPHPLCREVESLMETTEVTPAEVTEELMKSSNVDVALEGVVNLVKRKKADSDELANRTEISNAKRQRTIPENVST